MAPANNNNQSFEDNPYDDTSYYSSPDVEEKEQTTPSSPLQVESTRARERRERKLKKYAQNNTETVKSNAQNEEKQDTVAADRKTATETGSATPPIATQQTETEYQTGNNEIEPDEEDIDQFIRITQRLEQELNRIVVGQETVIRELLLALLAGGHVLLEGVPGLGKTLLVRTLADALDLHFTRIQFTPDLMPADIVGTTIVTEESDHTGGNRRIFSFQPGPIFANIVLADEINRATPKTQSALLEGMQEHTVSVGDRTRPLPHPFFVLATQNPLEMEGTYTLPEAQLDRFIMKIMVTFPGAKDLLRIIDTTLSPTTLRASKVASGADLARLIEIARAVPIATHIKEYAVNLLLATHPDQESAPEKVQQYVRYGASPRGLQAMIATAKVRALLEGRYNVSLEDIRSVAFPALRHRIVLNFDGMADNISSEQLIEIILSELENE